MMDRERMMELEPKIHALANLARLVTDKAESLDCGEKGRHGEDVLSFADGELEAFLYGIYEINRMSRELRKAYLDCFPAVQEPKVRVAA